MRAQTLTTTMRLVYGLMLAFFSMSTGQLMLAADWPSFGHDTQRSGADGETILSPENSGNLELKWSTQVDNIPLALNSLSAPITASNVATPQGAKSMVFVAGSSNTVFALDIHDGKVIWNRKFDSAVLPHSESFFLCPNAANATPVIDPEKATLYTIADDGKLYGLDLASGKTKFGPFQFVPAFAKAWSLNFYEGVVYTSTSQGCGGDRSGIYAMNVKDPMRPESHELLVRKGFGAGMWARGGVVIDKNHRLFTSTGDGNFDPETGDYGSTFLSVTLPDLSLADYYSPSNWKDVNKYDLDIPSGGLLAFTYKHRDLIAGGGKESVVYLLDEKSLGGKDHHTPVYATPVLANEARELEQKGMWGAPAVWTDPKNNQTWLYLTIWGSLAKQAPAFPIRNGEAPNGCIVAFQVVDDAETHQPVLKPAWISPDFNLPDAPVVANGVLFALSTGENSKQVHDESLLHFASVEDWKKNLLTTEQRAQGTHPAVLLALDAKTGKPLYQSGDAMKSWTHFSGLALSESRVFAVDHSSRIYCFGLKERPTIQE